MFILIESKPAISATPYMWSRFVHFFSPIYNHTLMGAVFVHFFSPLQSTPYMWSSICELLALVTLWLRYNLVFHQSQNPINIGLQIMTEYVRHLHCCKSFELCQSNLGLQGWLIQPSPCIGGARIQCVRIIVRVLEDCEERAGLWYIESPCEHF